MKLEVHHHYHIPGDGCSCRCGRDLNARMISAVGRNCATMPTTTNPVTLIDTEQVVLSIMPRKGNAIDVSLTPQWVSSDPAQVGIEAQEAFEYDDSLNGNGMVQVPAGYRAIATTPLAKGKANVTVSAAGYDSAIFPITYTAGLGGSLNPSVGDPQLE